ncbi:MULTISPECIES: hypothetical protein [Eisenbergiella]|uniref:hypothetical protein n=1 Tax=Eisenbergiella TaxID=1432051 RepID=UPI0023F001CC|nr:MULTISPECIES: hypothetical protein [Eisenbergiella]MDY5525416.1 hypothetical protein [Eisenbergiella porci]
MINGRLFSFLVIYILKFGGKRISGYQVYIGSVPPEEMVCDFGAAGMAGGDLEAGGGFLPYLFRPWR